MILLPNGCRCSEIGVFPPNWKKTLSVKKDWYLHYRFYDSSGRVLPVMVRGMNHMKDADDRRRYTQSLIDNELHLLKTEGYNPVMKTFIAPHEREGEIDPGTPFTEALQMVLKKIRCVDHTREDIKSILKFIESASNYLRYSSIPIGNIKRRHLRHILDTCADTKKVWSANLFNHYRKYLSILFKELVELEAIEFNPVRDIAKQKSVKKLKRILSKEECQRVDSYLQVKDRNFCILVHIFFHSGARRSEIVRVKGKDVNLETQKFKCIIKKGKEIREVEKTIKNIAVPFWIEALRNCKADEYVFSIGLKPGTHRIREEQLTRRWNRHVKKHLGIDADFYSLKYLNSDQTAKILDLKAAAAQNSHTSTVVTMGYAVNEKERIHERLRNVDNSFT